jgi:hypothetical protein
LQALIKPYSSLKFIKMEKLVLETIQHSKLTDIDEIEPINDLDYEVLEEIKSVFVKHKYVNRFGIILLHKHFDIAEDEVLMETTNEEERISTVKVEKALNSEQNTIGTMWKFGNDIIAATKCVVRCHYFLGHKRKHVKEGS